MNPQSAQPAVTHPHQCPKCGQTSCPKISMTGWGEVHPSGKAFTVSVPRKCPACGTIFDPPVSKAVLGVGIFAGLLLIAGGVYLQTLPPDERPTFAQIICLTTGPFVIFYCVRRWLKGGAAHILSSPE